MGIIYRRGNILKSQETIIIHGANCQGRMGAGIAKQIKETYPMAYQGYVGVYRSQGLQLGQVIWVDCGRVIIGNALTQEFYGRDKKRYCSYPAIRQCMKEVNYYADEYYGDEIPHWGKHVAMPKIGAGLAGGDWNIISQIIEEELTEVQPIVYEL